MAYQFELDDRSVRRAVQRIARERANAALTALDDRDLDETVRVHEIRKDIKKLRGLIRLVRPVFPDYARENRWLGDTGRLVSGARDAAVLTATLADLGEAAALGPDRIAAVAVGLGLGPADVPAPSGAVAEYAKRMKAFRGRIAKWRFDEKGWDALAPGLERTWGAARRAARAARREASAEALHEFRKRVKDHWYQARLLAPVWPAAMALHADSAGDLGEALGQDRDIALALDRLAALPDSAAKLALLATGRRRRDVLAREAVWLADRLLAETPEALSARWGAWWVLWQNGR